MKLNTEIISLHIDKQYPLRGFNVRGKTLYNINKENKMPMSKFSRKCTNPYEKNFKTLITMRNTEKLRSRKGLPCQLLKHTLNVSIIKA